MNKKDIFNQIKNKRSFLCVGLDTDISRIPSHLLKTSDPIFEFNKSIIDATQDLCIAYKLNTAFYESNGVEGWKSLEKTLDYIPSNIFTIADAKRGDIGNTSKMYASAFFKNINFDSITVNPYMGADSVVPFLEFKNKWVILLALTSNEGSSDFQFFKSSNKKVLYEEILDKSRAWGTEDNMMYVVGASQANMLSNIRKYVPNHFLLIPGVGIQGGNLEDIVKYGITEKCGLIVNSSRALIYAGDGLDFTVKTRAETEKIQHQMDVLLNTAGI
ncbi:MAG: orotidine-5'-phosphate decarboxylase [Bacteroidota bacterium]|nr:orotidine-5'-phosphate decarboxylase [Bacteroidota bacterium]